mmetsp:Transcript_12016/g.21835  ORF Transcript_12016/g.21835 Transcript_12016/m.21835 type:complete len:90 (-) Transcript_12016:789-1058(-)
MQRHNKAQVPRHKSRNILFPTTNMRHSLSRLDDGYGITRGKRVIFVDFRHHQHPFSSNTTLVLLVSCSTANTRLPCVCVSSTAGCINSS